MAQLSQSQQAFIDRFAPYANLAALQLGLPSRVILGKLAIESDWGQKMGGNNIAGLKTSKAAAQNEGSIGSGNFKTFEDSSSGRSNITDSFLRYATPEQGIGGFVNWITNSGIPGINALADRSGGAVFAPDAKLDQAAINALNSSPYSTDKNLPITLPQRVAMIPDLTSYGVASSFDPTLNRLAQLAPYQAGGTDVSLGAGDITSNNYWSGRRYQAQGEVLPREKNANGLQLPSPEMAGSPQQLGALDKISDGLTGGLRAGANLIGNRFVEATGRLPSAEEFGARIDALKSGASNLITQLTEIASSPEAKTFAQSTGLDPNQYVVNDIYRLGLGRNADAASLPQQMEVLRTQGAQGLLNSVTNSQEGRTFALENYYGNVFGHEADTPGMNYWLGQLAAGKTMPAVQAEILASPEAQAIEPSVREQLAGLITPSFLTPTIGFTGANAGTIGSGPDAGTSGFTGTQTGTIGNPAFSPAINNWYEGILQRAPDAQGGQNYQNLLDAGVAPNIIEAQILNSGEAAQTLGPDKLASLLNNYQTVNGLSAQDAATLSPFASEFAKATGRGMDVGTQQWWDAQSKAGTPQSLPEAQILGAPETIQAHTGNLDSLSSAYSAKYGLSPTDVSTLAPLANEFQQLTGRGIDTPTLQDWGRQTAGGTPLSIIEAGLLNAPEVQQARTGSLDGLTSQYQAKYGLTPTEVNTLSPLASQFQQATGRGVDTPTLQWWDKQLDAGTPQSILQAQLLTAPEVQARGPDATASLVNDYQTQYGLKPQEVATLAPLASQFSQLLGRPVDTPTLQNWDAQIDAGTSMPALQAQLLQAPEVTARTGGQGDLYNSFQGQYGRSASDYLAGLSNPTGFSGANVSGNVGPGTFSGTFDPTQYLAANPDVKAAGMDPLTHYLTYGFNENRALDTAGDRINQGFDPTAYLAQNPDVAAAKMDPLAHYLEFGAHEGRAAPTGSNPYSFSNSNVGGYQVPNGSGSGAGGSLSVNNASGAANGLGGSGGAGGSAFGYTDGGGNPQVATFNPQASELSYLQGQVNQNNQMIAAGQQETANNPNAANGALANIGFGIQTAINPAATIGAGIQNFGGNAAIGSYSMPAVTPLPAIPVLPGGLRGTAAIGGYPGGNGFGGAGGFF